LELRNHILCLFSAHCDFGHQVYLSLRQIPAEAFDMSLFVPLEIVFISYKIVTCALDTPDFIILYHSMWLHVSTNCMVIIRPLVHTKTKLSLQNFPRF